MKYTLGIAVLISVAIVSFWAGVGSVEAPEPETIETQAPFRDGVYLGFIHYAGSDSISFDDAIWLSGKEGQDHAIERGLCTEETRTDCLPNDYIIKNADEKDEELSVSADAKIVMQTYDAGEFGIMDKEISLDEFAHLLNDKGSHWNKLPYNVTIHGGKVVKIEEIYIP